MLQLDLDEQKESIQLKKQKSNTKEDSSTSKKK